MNCLMEAIGIALPGNGSILAVDKARMELVRKAGSRIVDLVEKDIKPLDIINEDAIRNAFALDMAMGGSTNTVLHTLAIAKEANLNFDLSELNKISKKLLTFVKLVQQHLMYIWRMLIEPEEFLLY